MTLLALLTGVLFMVYYSRLVQMFFLITLPAWGLLAASTPLGSKILPVLHQLSGALDGWLR
ncbi:hypothetical protein [Actinomadura macrotermitis]|uniref:Uncharacterized protein n=1 Tax=Actinomadura macrotermitis TaxID=2585200 RepID=A0A7K0C2A2_9ACTN|nr:hypothetical protein [Actinomadura macrotermitis]MQY07252.1 hypothetical protein [Actinomadura macrotermitis]